MMNIGGVQPELCFFGKGEISCLV